MSFVSKNVGAALTQKSLLESFLRGLQVSIAVLGGGGTIILLMAPMFAISNNGLIPFLVVAPLIFFGSALAHEMGHAVAATLLKMTVLQLRVGPFQCAMLRNGARIRLRQQQEIKRAHLSGYVIAIPSLHGSLRKQHVWSALGGPLANLAIAALSAFIGYALLPSAIAFVGFAIAWLNWTMAIGNLIPTKRLIESDGRRLLHWLRAKDYKITPYQRVMALLIQGTRADELPCDVIEAVDSLPAPMPLVALYIRLQAHQNCAQWDAACAIEIDLERMLSEMSETTAEAWSDFLTIVRTELAFSKAMRDRDGRHLSDSLLPRATAWLVPYLRPRCVALHEGLAGNISARDRQFDLVMRHAKKSLDRSVVRSEALLIEYIRASSTPSS